MKCHLFTAVSRFAWLLPLYESIRLGFERSLFDDWEWTLILEPRERELFPSNWFLRNVSLFIADENTILDYSAGLNKYNEAIGAMDIHPETWVSTISDDNLIPVHILHYLSYFISSFPQKDVFITSHKRGQRKDKHDCHDFVAAPENTRVNFISGEQYFFKRKHWAELPNYDMGGDGHFIEELYQRVPDKFQFMPDAWTTFDAQKASRWDLDKMKEIVWEKGGLDL